MSDGPGKDYDTLCEKLRDISNLEGISELLGWDEMVMMPAGAAEARAKQKSTLAGVVYDKETDPSLGEVLSKLAGAMDKLDPYQAAVVRDAKRNYKRVTSTPKKLAQRKAELESEGYQAWVAARKDSDFSQFAPVLQQWVDLVREIAACVDPSRPAYDVALEEYEPGMTSARLDQVFEQVREGLVPFIKLLREQGSAPDDSKLQGTFEVAEQAALCHSISKSLGFNTEKGRLDVSVHPFTGGCHPTDVRMTTRFKPDDLTEGLTGAIHETGHSLYEQGRNLSYDGLPVNKAMSMGVHESQSLFWERMVANGQPFADYLLPQLTATFPQLPAGLTAADVYAAFNRMRTPSLVRVEADEITYPMHIILRYELEKGLLDGSVAVADLPRLWNERMEHYLGCTPPSDAVGVLQDIHWSIGLFGYFPTYTLGAMYACQIYQEAKKHLPTLEEDIRGGKFAELRAWLLNNIHTVGSLYPSGDALMEAISGAPLDPSVFLTYLKAKYSALYKLEQCPA